MRGRSLNEVSALRSLRLADRRARFGLAVKGLVMRGSGFNPSAAQLAAFSGYSL